MYIRSKDEDILVIKFPEEEATRHFFGYVVHKFRHKYHKLDHVLEDTNNNNSWDTFISKGGLKIMNPEHRPVLLNLDKHFCHFPW